MEQLIRCSRCGKRYVFFGSISQVSFCPECLIAEEAEYSLVREYVRSNQGCSINDVYAATNVPTKKILRYLREEKLEIVGDNNFLKCEFCRNPINTGRFCPNCSKRAGTAVISKVDEDHSGKWRT